MKVPIFRCSSSFLQNSMKSLLLNKGFKQVTGTVMPPLELAARNASTYAEPRRLPVPQLGQTLEKYLRTVKPLLSEEEFTNTQEVVKNFGAPGGIGEKLQGLLVERANKEENWLQKWWIHAAYLDYRLPVVVHSNPGLVFPRQDFYGLDEQVSYAAKLILGALEYKSLIDNEKIVQETMGKEPLDMSQYKYLFGGCRIPGATRDLWKQSPDSRHIVVAHNSHFFRLEVLDEKGQPISEGLLKTSLLDLVVKSTHVVPAVGILTTENRNVWASAYCRLRQDPKNAASLDVIESALFFMCLDKPTNVDKVGSRTQDTIHMLHGGGSAMNSANRWFDKTIQLFVGLDGSNGLCYEHCPAEGPPVAALADYIVGYAQRHSELVPPQRHEASGADLLPFHITREIQNFIQNAERDMDILVSDVDLCSFTFQHFGKEDIKTLKFSPDSFIQVALQTSFIRLHGKPAAHYESGSTRKFLHGRTETIRSCLPEVVDFANSQLFNELPPKERCSKLQAAVAAHKEYAHWAVNGEGVDRHLLGLKLLAIENGMDVPSIFLDPGYTKSTHYRISTSQVASSHDMVMCFGAVVPDGYGCCYNPRKHEINFAVSAFNANEATSAAKFGEALRASLIEMRDLALTNMPAKL